MERISALPSASRVVHRRPHDVFDGGFGEYGRGGVDDPLTNGLDDVRAEQITDVPEHSEAHQQ